MQRLPLILLCLVVVATTAAESQDKRIIGGQTATPHSHPYIVSVWYLGHECGGTIISERWVLTAAHCLDRLDLRFLSVVVGANSITYEPNNKYSRRIRVANYIIHKDYTNDVYLRNDLALLKLEEPIDLNEMVAVANLAPKGYDVDPGSKCIISGWGRTDGSDWESWNLHLQDVEISTIPSTYLCRRMSGWNVDEGNICAYEEDLTVGSCHGDSGGPMMCGPNHEFLTGVASYATRTCSGVSVYVRVSKYLDWIKEHTGIEA